MNKGQSSEAAPQNDKKYSIFTPYVEPSKGMSDYRYNLFRLQGCCQALSVRQCETIVRDARKDQFKWHEAR